MEPGYERHGGPPRVRREDPALITGEAEYTVDIGDETFGEGELVHAAILRSQYASASITGIDTSEAEALDGVVAVFTGADLAASESSGTIEVAGSFPGQETTPFSMLASDRARFTGEPVAVVLAEERYIAHDAADLIEVDYERGEVVTTIEEALAEDAPLVHESLESNRLFEWEFGDEAATDAAFEAADRAVGVDLTNQRLEPNPLEPRSAIGDYDADSGDLTVYASTQTPHRIRDSIAEMVGLSTDRVRVITPDVGGGFGAKGSAPKAGEPLAAWCSMQVGRPVKWVATRTENIRAGPHGRANRAEAELAVDDDGSMRGLRVEVQADAGAYLIWGQINVGHIKRLISGAYDIPAISGTAVGVVTNTAPIAPYRGAGRPESNYIVERLVKRAAAELDMDPAELRRRNFVQAEEFPFETAVGTVYDSGDYEGALDLALDTVGYEDLRERQADLREEGRYLGIGIGSFVENTGTPGGSETARVELGADGRADVVCGTASHGQGHATAFSQLVADELGIDYDDVEYSDGDTANLERGVGTFASRSAPMGGGAVVEGAREVREAARRVAADRFETSVEDVEFEDGEFFVAGAPSRSIHIREVAELVHSSTETPIGPEDLRATTDYDIDDYAFTFGTHVAVVEVDPDSGEIDFERYLAVDDCGVQFNPLLVEGQIHGAVAQGIEETLYGNATYDANGTLVTGSLQDYALIKAEYAPEIETESTVTPSPVTQTGAKGTGESGTIAAPPTIVNAVVDALEPFGVEHLDKPITPEKAWRRLRDSDGG